MEHAVEASMWSGLKCALCVGDQALVGVEGNDFGVIPLDLSYAINDAVFA